MISRSESKYIQSLSHKKHREQEGIFIAEGPKIAEELLSTTVYEITKIYAVAGWIQQNPQASRIAIEVSEDELQKISAMQTANQVLILVETKTNIIPAGIKGKLSLVLDGIQDPGNFGTIIRIADWFGIENIICSNDCVELYNPKVIQSTMGSFIRVNVCHTELNDYLRQQQLPVYGTLLHGTDIKTITQPKEGMVVIGNEGKGIREHILPHITKAVSIKKYGGAESLNAAVATGIILSHWTN